MNKRWIYLFGFLLLIALSIWIGVFSTKSSKMQIIACDVGQGDAILVVYGENEILIDGGANNDVLNCLSTYIPYWDRKIEVVILTHPQLDHYGGLTKVFETYEVDIFVANSLETGSQRYQVLEKAIGGSGARILEPDKGVSIRLGLMHLDILHPSKEYLLASTIKNSELGDEGVLGEYTTSRDPNIFSIVAKLSLGNFDALMTGDIDPELSDSIGEMLISQGLTRSLEYIKVPHHGSKNGMSKKLLEVLSPTSLAVISAGKNNSYGHPHKEILDMLGGAGIKIFRTDESGDVVVETDGKTWSVID